MKNVKIGRVRGNDVVIDYDQTVSKFHCQITREDDGTYRLVDLDSTNGTFVNGVKRFGEVTLEKTDIVRVGKTTLAWGRYFRDPFPKPKPKPGPDPVRHEPESVHVMKVINIGRHSSNDICIRDKWVSGVHCQLIQDARGNVTIVDVNSKNGTYVNGRKRYGPVKLNKSDIVRIGNTTLPWRDYIKDQISISPKPTPAPELVHHEPASAQKSGLGIVALIASLAGAGLLVYVVVQIMKWGILAFIGGASTFAIISLVINILALVLAYIADTHDYKDDDAANIAKAISGFCLVVLIGGYLYLKFGDPNALNPFK